VSTGYGCVRVTLNVQFNDGTVWQDKILNMPYRP
jgi:hypothetical protein